VPGAGDSSVRTTAIRQRKRRQACIFGSSFRARHWFWCWA
jgi:hypothetical protein